MSKKVYAVKKGREVGIFSTWDECKRSVSGYPGALHKSFATVADANAYLQMGHTTTTTSTTTTSTGTTSTTSTATVSTTDPCTKTASAVQSSKRLHADTDPSPNPLAKRISIASAPSTASIIKLARSLRKSKYVVATETVLPTKTTPNPSSALEPVHIYTDGACSGNGKEGARGGIGVFFAPNDPRNISEPLPGLVQTNNRAEILATVRALRVAPDNPIILFTDSKYVCSGITQWIIKWKKKNWKTASGSDVSNKDLWVELDSELKARTQRGAGIVKFEYIRAHAGLYGNSEADTLAVQGAARFGEGLASMMPE
ncbi:Ribonuclease H1 [Chytriomyces hyalinus]|nr:Ribonuclease H1 [Chytriomyces hyalinus]